MGITISDAKMEGYAYSPNVRLAGSVLTVDPAPCKIGADQFEMEGTSIDFKPDSGKQFALHVIRRQNSNPTFYLVVSDMNARPKGTPEDEAGAEKSYVLVSGTVTSDGTVNGRVVRFGW
jgi:hypothetical protein